MTVMRDPPPPIENSGLASRLLRLISRPSARRPHMGSFLNLSNKPKTHHTDKIRILIFGIHDLAFDLLISHSITRTQANTVLVMLVHTTLASTQTVSHAWNHPQAVPFHPPAASWMHPTPRYTKSHTNTQLHLYTGGDKDLNIDDVLLEAEFALQAAETSLSSPPPKDEESKGLARSSVDAMAGAIGGTILGGLLGTVVFLQFPDLDLLISPIILPMLFSFILGTLGFASGFATTTTAAAIQQVLGSPIKAILSSLGLLARAQVEKGAEEVKAIPSKMATSVKNSVTQTVEQVSNDIQTFPSRVTTATKKKVTETLENVNVGATLAIITIPVLLYLYATTAEQFGGSLDL